MPKAKKKTLPKAFGDLLTAGDLEALKAVFDTCELEARGGYGKQTALAFNNAPEPLIRWLVEQGADLEALDSYGRTPLYHHAGAWNGKVALLLELGADIHATDRSGDTPLHRATASGKAEAVRLLLARGARADVRNGAGLTPLELGLRQCSNIQIVSMADIAPLLLAATPAMKPGLLDRLKGAFSGGASGSPVTPDMQAAVTRIGENFEFHRAGFNPDSVDEFSDALDRLYATFDVTPVARRRMHDGKAPILVPPGKPADQHDALWQALVPSSGAAKTVQGEVIRIAGRITDEVERNGGVNWDADYSKMGQAFLDHIATGAPLPDPDRAHAAVLIREARTRDGAGAELCDLAVRWVALNPTPMPLATPDYRR